MEELGEYASFALRGLIRPPANETKVIFKPLRPLRGARAIFSEAGRLLLQGLRQVSVPRLVR